jgi:hypothetical protein
LDATGKGNILATTLTSILATGAVVAYFMELCAPAWRNRKITGAWDRTPSFQIILEFRTTKIQSRSVNS